MTFVEKLRSRAWEDRHHRELREQAASRIEELEALLREIDNKVIFETAVIDGTGRHLQERIEAALGIGN